VQQGWDAATHFLEQVMASVNVMVALKFAAKGHVWKEFAPLLIRGPSRAPAKMAMRRKRDQILAILWRLVQKIPLAVGIPSTAFAIQVTAAILQQ